MAKKSPPKEEVLLSVLAEVNPNLKSYEGSHIWGANVLNKALLSDKELAASVERLINENYANKSKANIRAGLSANPLQINSAVNSLKVFKQGSGYRMNSVSSGGRAVSLFAPHSLDSNSGITQGPPVEEPPSVKRGFKLPPNPGPFQTTLGTRAPSVQTVFPPKPSITMPTFKKQVASGLFEGATPGVTVPSAKDFRTMETSGFHSIAGTLNMPDASKIYAQELAGLKYIRSNSYSNIGTYKQTVYRRNALAGEVGRQVIVPGIDPRIANNMPSTLHRHDLNKFQDFSSRGSVSGSSARTFRHIGAGLYSSEGEAFNWGKPYQKGDYNSIQKIITGEYAKSPQDARSLWQSKLAGSAYVDNFTAHSKKSAFSDAGNYIGKMFEALTAVARKPMDGSLGDILGKLVKPSSSGGFFSRGAGGGPGGGGFGPGGASGLMSAALAHGGGGPGGGAGGGGGGGGASATKFGGFGRQVFDQFRHAAIWSGYSPLLAAGAVVGSAMIGQQDYVSQPAFSLIGAGFKRPEREASKMWALNTAGAYQKPQEKLGVLKALTSAFGESPTAANLGKLQHLSNVVQNTALYTMGSPEDIAQFAGRATNTLMSKDKSVKGQSRDEVMKGVLNMVSGMSETETIKLPGIVTASKYALPSLLNAGFSGPEAYGMMQYFQEQGLGDSQVGVGFRKLSSGQPIVDKMAKTAIIREELEKAFAKYGYNRAAVNKVAPLMGGRWSEASLAKKDPNMLARLTKKRAEIGAAMKGDVKGLGLAAINYGKNIEYFLELGLDPKRLADQESLPLLYSFAQMDSTKEFREFVDKRKKDYKDPSRNDQTNRDRQLETDTPRGAASVLWNKSEAALYRIAQSRGVPLMKGALRSFNDSQAAESLEWATVKGDKESVTSLVAQTRDLASRGEAEAITPEAIRGAKNLQDSRNITTAERMVHIPDLTPSHGLTPLNKLLQELAFSVHGEAASMADDAELGMMGWGGIYNDRQRLNFEGTRTRINPAGFWNSVKGFFGYNYDKKNTLFLNEYTGETPFWGGAVEQFPNQPNGMMPSQGEINTTQKQIEAGSFTPIIHIYIDGVKQDSKQVNANATVNGQPTSPTQAPASTGGNQ